MAISINTAGTWADSNATTQTVTLPTHAAGDMLILRAVRKPFTNPDDIVCNTSGWAEVGAGVANGSTASGVGTGSMAFKAFWKIATSSSETNPVVTWGTTSTPGAAVAISYQKATNEVWDTPTGTGGGDATARTAQTSTMSSHITVRAGDMVDFFRAMCDDSGTLTVPTITQTGVTYGTVSEQPAAALSSGTSQDISADGGYRLASSGASSAAAVITGTSSSSEQHGAWQTRMRVMVPGFGQAQAHIKAFNVEGFGQAQASIDAPSCYVNTVLLDNPSVFYAMQDASGNLRDSAPAGNDAVVSGTALTYRVATGFVGLPYGATFASGSLATALDNNAFDMGDGPFTIELIFKRTAIGTDYPVFEKTGAYVIEARANNLFVLSDGTFSANIYHDNVNTDTSNWHHWVWTRGSGVSGEAFLDGVASTGEGARTFSDTTGDFVLGPQGGTSFSIAALAIYPTQLSAPQVAAHYTALSLACNCYYDTVIADAPVAYWRLGETSGTNFNDEIGTLDGTSSGSPTLNVTGALIGDSNKAVTFDGTTGQHIDVADNAALDLGNGPFTIEMWIKRSAIATDDVALQKGAGSYGVGFQGGGLPDDKWKLSKTGVDLITHSDVAITDTTTWHHVVVTHSASGAGNTLIYTDGVEGHTDENPDLVLVDTTDALTIGYEPAYEGFRGSIDEVALYNYVLTPVQVLNHYAARTVACPVGAPSVYAQAQADIKQTYRGYAQAQADIKQTYRGFAQAQADIKQTYRGYGQAQADIKATSRAYAQAQADIKQTYQAYAQAQADIKQTYNGFGQAQAFIMKLVWDDTFSRTVVNDIGTSDSGGQYYVTSAEKPNVDSGYLYADFPSTNAVALLGIFVAGAAGPSIVQFDFYTAGLEGTSSSIKFEDFQLVVSNSEGAWGVSVTGSGSYATTIFSPGVGEWWTAKAYLNPSATTVRAKVWQVGTQEPDWQGISTSASISAEANKIFINSDTNEDSRLDNFKILTADNVTYTRTVHAQAQVKINAFNVRGFGQAQAFLTSPNRGYGQANAFIKKYIFGYHLTTDSSSTDATSYLTASITPTSNRLVLAAVWNGQSGANTTPTLSGNGLTWVLVDQAAYDVSGTFGIVHVFRAMGSSPSSGQVTIDFGGATMVGAGWSISEFEGVDTSGTNGSGAIVQSDSAIGLSASASVTLAAFSDIRNAAYGALAQQTADVETVGSGFYRFSRSATATPITSITSFWNPNNDTTVDASWTNAAEKWGIIGIEIKAVIDISQAFAQAQADIKQTYNGFAQAQADIKQTYRGYAQAQADIKQTYRGYGQAQAHIINTYQAYGQAGARIGSGGALTWVQDTFTRTESGTLGTPDIGPTYQMLGTYQGGIIDVDGDSAEITNGPLQVYSHIAVYNVEQRIDFIFHDFNDVTSHALSLYSRLSVGSLANYVNVSVVYYSFTDNTLDIGSVINNVGQGGPSVTIPTILLDTEYTLKFAVEGTNARAKVWKKSDPEPDWLVTTVIGTIPANAVGIYTDADQEEPATWKSLDNYFVTEVLNTGFGQARAGIKQTYRGYAQSKALITHGVTSIVDSFTRSVSNAFGTADTGGAWTVETGSAADFDVTGSLGTIANAHTTHKISLEDVLVPQSFDFYANFIISTLPTSGNFYFLTFMLDHGAPDEAITTSENYLEVIIDSTSVGAQGYINSDAAVTTSFVPIVANDMWAIKARVLSVGATRSIYLKIFKLGDAEPDFSVGSGTLAESGFFSIKVSSVFAASAATWGIDNINLFPAYPQAWGQAQADIKHTYNAFAQAQADVKQTYRGYGQAQACVKGNAFGQAQARIKQTYRGYAQAQAQIKQTYRGYGQAQADIKQTYRAYAQAQADIKQTYRGFAQAQADIKQVYRGYAQAQASILLLRRGHGQAAALISGDFNTVLDTFTRTLPSTWGTADVGGSWTVSSPNYSPEQVSVNGSEGVWNNAGNNQQVVSLRRTLLPRNVRVTFTFRSPLSFDQLPGFIDIYLHVPNTGYNFSTPILGMSQGDPDIQGLRYYSDEWGTTYIPVSYNSDEIWELEVQLLQTNSGSHWKLRAWKVGTPVPAWQIDLPYSKTLIPGHLQLGNSGETGLVENIYIDNLNAYEAFPQGFGQAQVSIKATSNAFAQAQADIKQTYQAYAQAQADVLQVYQGYAQAQAWIEQTYNQYAQAQADIKATSNTFAQAQAKMNAFGVQAYGQALSNIKGVDVEGVAQAQAKINAFGVNAHAQAQATIKATYNAFAQAQAQVIQTYQRWAQAQADIKQTYFGFAQANANIEATVNAFAQAQADIKATYQAYGQAQAKISTTRAYGQAQACIRGNAFGQAQADIKQTYRGYAQANADIKATSNAFAQAQADIKQTYRGYANAQADIKATYKAFAQAQADVKQTYVACGQAQACIKGNAFGQAQAQIKQVYFGHAQAQADVKAIYFGFAQAQADIEQTYNQHAQAQAQIKQTYQAYAQAQADILATYQAYAQAGASIKQVYYAHAQAEAWIEQTFNAYAQAQANIEATYNSFAQAQADILAIYQAYAQAMAYIKVEAIEAIAQAQADIKTTYQAYAQANAKINAFGVQAYGQAQGNVRFNGSTSHAQAQAKINAFNYPRHAQAQAWVEATVNSFGQAQADILATYRGYGQANADIKQSYQAYANAQADIKQTYQAYANSQAYIVVRDIESVGQAQADIKQTYFGFAQSNAWIEQTYNGFGQAQAYILSGNNAYAQAQGLIVVRDNEAYAQAQADIKQTYQGYAQSQALIGTANRVFAQAQGSIKATSNACGNAQADIKQTYQAYANAQADIKQTYFGFAQANAYIIRVTQAYAQAQAYIKIVGQVSGNAQADILVTTNRFANAQAYISTNVIRIAQAQAQIKVISNTHAQAQALITSGTFGTGQAQALIQTTENAFGQAQATILKSAGYGQANALIIQLHTLKKLVVSDRINIGLALSDRHEVSGGTDTIKTYLEISDRIQINLRLSDREGMDMTIDDIEY